jgi:hypothetical protein
VKYFEISWLIFRLFSGGTASLLTDVQIQDVQGKVRSIIVCLKHF